MPAGRRAWLPGRTPDRRRAGVNFSDSRLSGKGGRNPVAMRGERRSVREADAAPFFSSRRRTYDEGSVDEKKPLPGRTEQGLKADGVGRSAEG